MSPRARIAALALTGLCALGAACGGGTTPAPARAGKSGATDKPGERNSEDTSGSEDEPAARVSRCGDGTCFECGAGLCPKGFYCDEKASGGAAIGAFLLGLVPVLLLEGGLQARFFLSLDPEVITSCCGSLFSRGGAGPGALLAELPPLTAAVALYATAGAAISATASR